MQAKMDKYKEVFDEQFPLMLVQGMSDKEIAAVIDGCLRSGKPYEPEPNLKY